MGHRAAADSVLTLRRRRRRHGRAGQRMSLGPARWLLLLAAGAFACDQGLKGPHWSEANTPIEAHGEQKIEVPPPPFSEGMFPCTECHDPENEVNTTKRKLSMAHQDIVLHHDEQHRWCLDCHAAANRDKLHLASGELIDFTESYRLCGQCHGDKYRDWRAGVHGLRTGQWNGHKSYLLCVNCHNAHAPAFQPLAPLPPPRRPERS